MLCSKQIVRGAERRGGRRRLAAREWQWRRQVDRGLRAAASALGLPSPRSRASQLPTVGPPGNPRQIEQPSFLMGVTSSP